MSLLWVSLFFYQLNETTSFATLKFCCQILSSLKDWFCRFYKAYLVLHYWKYSALLEQDIVLRNYSIPTEACHLVLARGDRPKENTWLFASTSLAFLLGYSLCVTYVLLFKVSLVQCQHRLLAVFLAQTAVTLFYLLFSNDRQKATKVKYTCKCWESLTKQSIFVEYSLLRRIWVLLELVCKSTQHFIKIDQNPMTTGFIM